MRVLIVGAGPTGLTAAIELARQGIIATIIDRKEEASTLSRAVGILPGSLEILTPSGVTERLLAEGIKLRALKLFHGTAPKMTVSLQGGHPDWDYGIALAQDRTEAALREALVAAGGDVTYGCALTEMQQDDERVVAGTQNGKEAAYDLVIGADGIQSAVRQTLGLDYPGFDLPETWSIADVEAVNWPHGETFTLCMLEGGRVAVVAPLEAERYRVISNTEESLATLPLDLEVTQIHREGRFNISIRQVPDYKAGRVFLAGDAAHCHSPAGGRGMNLGIADAAELARRIIGKSLDGYSASRHAAGAQTIAASERIRRLVTSTGPLTRAAAFAAFSLIDRSPALQRRVARRFLSS
ncbi:MAG: FAD-dependent monooxygenase [Rhodospirillaceae bacterium]|nr:FAD-dependent monooxygenase [Rhodospirillaceae bacterium]MBT5459727.1 FAD-dependent monooxygenase [Rhodospirillaceae bacterium]